MTRSSRSPGEPLNSSSVVDFPECCGSQTRAPKNRRGMRRFTEILMQKSYACREARKSYWEDAPLAGRSTRN